MDGRMFVFAAAILLSHTLSAQTQRPDCSSLVTNRSFSQRFEGFLNLKSLVPTAGAGFLTFLPAGRVRGQITLAIGLLELVPDITFDKTSEYSLSWDTTKTPAVCSGTMTLNAPGEPSFHFQLLVSHGGRQIELIHTDKGLTVSMTALPMDLSGCSAETIRGQYSCRMKGWRLAAQSGAARFPPEQLLAGYFPLACTGAVEFRPDVAPAAASSGGVAGWDTCSLNGVILPRTVTGSFQVNPDCRGTMLLSGAGEDLHLQLFVDKSRRALYAVAIDKTNLPGAPGPVPAYVLGMILDRAGEE